MSGVSNYAIAVILCLQTLSACLSSTIGQYVYAFYLQTYPNSSNSTTIEFFNNQTDKCVHNGTSPDGDAQLWAQQRSANLFFWANLVSSCPMIIMTYILGLYTSKFGKRVVLLLPIIGSTGQIVIWLAIIYFHLPEFWWYIAAFIIGLSGSSGIFDLTLNLIITENTIENKRSARFVRFEATQTALSAIATLGIGYYIIWRGFTDLYWIALFLQILSIIVVLFFFKSADSINLDEQRPLLSSTNEEFKELSPTTCGHFLAVCTVFRLNRRSTKKSISLYFTLFANIFYMLALTSYAPLLWIQLSAPFCWTSKDIGIYSAANAVSWALLSLLGIEILTYARASDAMICAISHVFFCAACLWMALAQYGWQLYVRLLISGFAGYQRALTTSMMSKWLAPHERNHAFTLVSGMNMIMATLGNSLFNWIYARTVDNHRTLTLFIGVGLGIIPFILNLCLVIITRQISDEEIPSLSEIDIEPTPFRLSINIPPLAGVSDSMILLARASICSLRTPPHGRSRITSIIDNRIEEIINTPVNDLVIL